MHRLFSSLAVKVSALFLLGAAVLQLATLVAVLWPDDRPLLLRLIDLVEIGEIAEALETVRPDQQDALVAAVNNGALVVGLLPHFPEGGPSDDAGRLQERIGAQLARHADALAGRRYRIELARPGGAVLNSIGAAPMRLVVELRTGQALTVQREPVVLTAIATRYGAITAVIVAVLLAILLILSGQVVRPISRLAAGVDAFRTNILSRDVVPAGTRELRELAVAFNAMKKQIGSLVTERTRVLAAIAHDLRTYLTRLRLRADFIDDAEQRTKAINDLAEMEQLLDDVLLFARNDETDLLAVPVIDARDLAADYVTMRREMGDAVTLEAGTEPALCRCAPLAFRRILGNLVDNAIRYGQTATVRISVEDAVFLAVEDNGPGIPPENVEQLIRPFERLEPSRGRTTGGAGLGLAIVKGLVESSGGTVAFANLREGLRVTVTLSRAG